VLAGAEVQGAEAQLPGPYYNEINPCPLSRRWKKNNLSVPQEVEDEEMTVPCRLLAVEPAADGVALLPLDNNPDNLDKLLNSNPEVSWKPRKAAMEK
jgi:hypothetical protein